MQWIAPSEKDTATNTLEKRLWEAADQLRANSGLTAAQYSTPVLGLIFLRFAEARFAKRRAELKKAGSSGRRAASRIDEPGARYERLLNLPEGENVGKKVNEAMADIEKHNPRLCRAADISAFSSEDYGEKQASRIQRCKIMFPAGFAVA